MTIKIKTPEEIEKMRVAGRMAAEVLEMIEPHIQVGRYNQRAEPDLPRLHRQ